MEENEDPNGQDEPDVNDFALRAAPQRVVIELIEEVSDEYAVAGRLPDELAQAWDGLWPGEDSLPIQPLFPHQGGLESTSEPRPFYEVMAPSSIHDPGGRPAAGEIASLFNRYSRFVVRAYVESPPAPQPDCPDTRLYLCDPPHGMGVAGFLGPQAGAGVRIVDLERFWAGSHTHLPHLQFPPSFRGPEGEDDFLKHFYFAPDTTRPSDDALRKEFWTGVAHSTGALGILGAKGGPAGLGLVPGAELIFASSYVKNEEGKWVESLAAQIDKLTDRNNGIMRPGDILLVEHQVFGRLKTNCSAEVYAPVELEPAICKALADARAREIIVIEPAGNGQRNLADLRQFGACEKNEIGLSGAIMVAACQQPDGQGNHNPLLSSNRGTPVKCYAWGEQIMSLHPTKPMDWFGETSAASALVAGVAALLQSLEINRSGQPLMPQELTEALSPSSGPLQVANINSSIGVMPNLPAIVGRVLQLV